MRSSVVRMLSALVLGFGICTFPAIAAETTKEATVAHETPVIAPGSDFGVLLGQWVRPDGGYTITIVSVDPDGKLDAIYANPGKLPFAEARASSDDNAIKVFFQLRAGGYNGSTYNLTYDPANDVLQGVYYQAVAQQKFDVYFKRIK